MNASDVIAIIEKNAPLLYQASWDKSGIQLPSSKEKVEHVGVCLEATKEQIEKAIELGIDFIISHHPLLMKARFLDKNDAFLQKVKLLLGHDIYLYTAHTSLDAQSYGPVSWLAKSLQLTNLRPLELVRPSTQSNLEQKELGFGFIGDLEENLACKDFIKKLFAELPKKHYPICGPLSPNIRKVACCPGSGTSMLELAKAQGADIFITGDVKYHTAVDTEIMLIDVGHFFLEEIMMKHLAEELKKQLQVPVTFLEGRDPFYSFNEI